MSADTASTENLGRFRELAASLRRGESADAVRTRFEGLVSGTTAARVGPTFLELAAGGTHKEELRRFVEWFGSLGRHPVRPGTNYAAGHPVVVFRSENEALKWRVDQCRMAMADLGLAEEAFAQAGATLKELSAVDNHYRRQEFLLFTRLERRGIVRPGRILWAAHDEVRQWLKYLDLQFASDVFDSGKLSSLAHSVVGPFLDDIEWMMFLEERVLLPMACDVLDETDWAVVRKHSPKIGWCLLEPGIDEPGIGEPEIDDRMHEAADQTTLPAGFPELPLPTGVLNLAALTSIHGELPVDLTFVDAGDRVQYFTEGSRPVFYRSEAILGRDVRCCHPPRSVHYVEQILSDFKSGRETSAQFWKHMGDRFIHIRFVALRDAGGDYQGTLEIAQDITLLRELEGQQLELRYDRSG